MPAPPPNDIPPYEKRAAGRWFDVQRSVDGHTMPPRPYLWNVPKVTIWL